MSTHPASAQLGCTQPTPNAHTHKHARKYQSHMRPKLCLSEEKTIVRAMLMAMQAKMLHAVVFYSAAACLCKVHT